MDQAVADALAAYDVRDAAHPRKVGHFTRPDLHISALTATDDGRVLLGADGVYVFDARAAHEVSGPRLPRLRTK